MLVSYGLSKTLVKSLETKIALQEGCDEIDMVANIAALKSHDIETVEQDILALLMKFVTINLRC